MKTNNNTVSGSLKESSYAAYVAYAAYLKSFYDYMGGAASGAGTARWPETSRPDPGSAAPIDYVRSDSNDPYLARRYLQSVRSRSPE